MANPEQTTISLTPPSAKRLSIRYAIVASAFLLLLLTAGAFYFFSSKPSALSDSGIYANADGSVKQVEDYIKQNFLFDHDSFTPIHWSKLQKRDVFGTISYTIGVIYKGKNNQNEMVMNSKVFELDERGLILLVMDSGPMNFR